MAFVEWRLDLHWISEDITNSSGCSALTIQETINSLTDQGSDEARQSVALMFKYLGGPSVCM